MGPETKRGLARGGALICALSVFPALSAGCYSGLQLSADEAVGDGETDSAGADSARPDSGPGGSGGGDDEPPTLCNGEPGVSARPMLRLSPIEYENTMRDLLGDPGFDAEYDDNELDLAVTERGVRQLRNGAETAIGRRAEWTAPVYACDIETDDDDGCADALIDEFAPRAFRRPLQDGEREWLRSVYDDAHDSESFEDSMEILTETILQAPSFLYVHFEGEPVDGAPEYIRRLTSHEVANRLSYFVWDTMPDEALFAAAEAGELTSKEKLAEQVDRMLQDPRSKAGVARFVWEWVELDGGSTHPSLEEANKLGDLFPEYSPALTEAMRIETEALIADSVDNGSFGDLMTTNRAYVNRSLADLYGVTGGPVDDADWQWVELDPSQRSGLLTRAAFLTVYATPTVQSPIQRGVSVIRDVLCMDLGDPPANVDNTPPTGSDGGTIRDDVLARTSGADCSGCHNFINPLGFAFGNYDAIGRYQENELLSGLEINSEGEITAGDQLGPVANAVDLSEKLALSTMVRGCFADHWFEEAVGGELGELDDCERDRVLAVFEETGDIQEMIKEVVLSDTFRFVNVSEGE